jgi:hypothetical protein
MRKLCTNEVGGGQNEEKWKKHVLQLEKNVFSLLCFLVAPLDLHFKDAL